MSRDIPIIFSTPMILALLAGRKVMTRRLAWRDTPHGIFGDDEARAYRGRGWKVSGADDAGSRIGWAPTSWQKIEAGDRLWVREGWKPHSIYTHMKPSDMPPKAKVFYLADDTYSPSDVPGRPSIHMPRFASRLTLIVTETKIERLTAISEEDAIAEGISRLFTEEECRTTVGLEGTRPEDHHWSNYLWHGLIGRTITAAQSDAWVHQYSSYADPPGSFSSLWESLHGKGAWAKNPEVVALSFKIIAANIDAPEARAA